MSTPVEAVAAAILKARAPGQSKKDWGLAAARAALTVMREPTAAMIAAAALSAVEDDAPDQEGLGAALELLPPTGHPDGPAVLADIRRDYRAMIDEALR